MTRLQSRTLGQRIVASLWTHELSGCPVFLLASLALVQTLESVVKAGFKDAAHPSRHEPSLQTLTALELAKCAMALGLLYRDTRRRFSAGARRAAPPDEGLPLYPVSGEWADPQDAEYHGSDQFNKQIPQCYTTNHIYTAVLPIALLYLGRHQLVVLRRLYANQATLDIVDALVILFTGFYTYLLAGRPTPLRHWTSAFLQITALFLAHHLTKVPRYSLATYSLLFLTSVLSSLLLVMTSMVYQALRNVSFHKINVALFSSCLVGYAVAIFISPSQERYIPPKIYYRDIIASGTVIVLRIAGDFLSLAVLQRTSPFTVASITLLSTSLTTPLWHLLFWKTTPFSNVQWLASALAVYAALSYFLDPSTSPAVPANPTSPWLGRRSFVLSGLTLAPLIVILVCNPLKPIPHFGSYVWNEATANAPLLMPHQYDASYNGSALDATCVRRPLPISSEYVGPGARPDFHAFDNVLLVVFFSHARYDINLDGYREVYSPYFPNILFIGPGSREDRGFMHSYDVVVDSYMAEEDTSVGWYKMGGRMAHHMFYTAVKDNPCYAGYLWAPFDALLNVPRFMQFPQDHIWYHSPYTTRYIPNPAQRDGPALHPAPPAWTSERTPEEYSLEANAWGTDWDWWWGEKHVGLEVCTPAYKRIPLRMRQRLAGFTGGSGRFVGGSADTMYLPGHLRADFLDVLGTFLQTDCFLEIVLPTTLHLILPVGEEMVFVDHWWNNPPPWDTSYVRQKWEEGYEVDSFHSFHWGDIQDDGFFGPNKNSVADMRTLLTDSFKRQGISQPP